MFRSAFSVLFCSDLMLHWLSGSFFCFPVSFAPLFDPHLVCDRHCFFLDMTLSVAEALNPNKPKPVFSCFTFQIKVRHTYCSNHVLRQQWVSPNPVVHHPVSNFSDCLPLNVCLPRNGWSFYIGAGDINTTLLAGLMSHDAQTESRLIVPFCGHN